MENNDSQPSEFDPVFPQASRIEYVSLDLIDFHPLARPHSQDGLASLGRKMGQEGQLQNIVICPKAGGRYEVIAGAGRLTNAKAKNWDKILACIRDGLDEFQKLQIMLSENEEREAQSPIHKGLVYKGMLDSQNLTQEALAQKLGQSRQVVQQYLSLVGLPEAIREKATRVAFLGLKHYLQLLRLKTPEDQVQLAQNAIDGEWSVRELTAEVQKKLKLAPPKPKAAAREPSPPSREASAEAASPSPQPDKPVELIDYGLCRFTQGGGGTVEVEATYYRNEMDPAEFAETIEEELEEWLNSKEGACSKHYWLPETVQEMREFERLAENSPGPGPLYSKIFASDPLKARQRDNVLWTDTDELNPPGKKDPVDPKIFARHMVHIIRQWDLPKWDRRWLPLDKPKPEKNPPSNS